MEQLGFTEADQGEHVDALRAWAARRTDVRRINAYWSGGTPNERAREFLAMQWEIEQGLTCRVECIDGLGGWVTDVRTMKRRLRIRWRYLPAWLGDQWRRLACDFRRWWVRDVRGLSNPYRNPKGATA